MEVQELRDRLSALEAEVASLKASAAAGSVADEEVDYGWLVDNGGGGGASGVRLVGTDQSESESEEFTFRSETGSNVVVRVDDGEIVIGVYYS